MPVSETDPNPDPSRPLTGLPAWKRQVLDAFYLILAVGNLLILIVKVSANHLDELSSLASAIVFILLYGVFLWLAYDRQLSYRVRSLSLLAFVFLTGAISLFTSGIEGEGRVLLVLTPLIAVVLADRRAAWISAGLGFLCLLGYFLLAVMGGGRLLIQPMLSGDVVSMPVLISGEITAAIILGIALGGALVMDQFVLQKISAPSAAPEPERAPAAPEPSAEVSPALPDQPPAPADDLDRERLSYQKVLEEASQALKNAEAANRARLAFLSTLSHDLRTPVGAVLGLTDLMAETPLTLKQKELLDLIRLSNDQMLSEVSDLLDFTRLETGRIRLEEKPFSLRDCIMEAVNRVTLSAASKGRQVSPLYEDGLPDVYTGDGERLSQVITNLLSVSIRQSAPLPSGLGQADAVLTAQSLPVVLPPQYLIKLSINLSGGAAEDDLLAEEHLTRLLNPFEPSEDPNTLPPFGAGPGLWIARRLVELMGGEMGIERSGDLPTALFFTLPVRQTSRETSAPVKEEFGLRLAGRRILILNADPAARRTLTLQVQAWGMTPRPTDRPEIATQWLRDSEPFDALVLDGDLLGEAAFIQLTADLKQARPALPLLLLASTASMPRPENKTFAEVLVKPYKASQLYNSLVGIFSADFNLRSEGSAAPGADFASGVELGRTPILDQRLAEQYPLSVLVVEDNLVNQNMVDLILRRLGYQPVLAANGLEALESLRAQPSDLVLMDVAMPEMDGLEATARIRADFPLEIQPRIVAMTANALRSDRETCLKAGMDDYMAKPVHIDDLVSALKRSSLAKRKPAPLSPTPAGEPVPAPETEPAAAPASPPTLDPTQLNSLGATLGARAAAMLPSLVDGFTKQAGRLLDGIARCIDDNQLAEAARFAATLQSNSQGFGALRLAQNAQELERLARAGQPDELRQALEESRAEFEQVKAALAKIEI